MPGLVRAAGPSRAAPHAPTPPARRGDARCRCAHPFPLARRRSTSTAVRCGCPRRAAAAAPLDLDHPQRSCAAWAPDWSADATVLLPQSLGAKAHARLRAARRPDTPRKYPAPRLRSTASGWTSPAGAPRSGPPPPAAQSAAGGPRQPRAARSIRRTDAYLRPTARRGRGRVAVRRAPLAPAAGAAHCERCEPPGTDAPCALLAPRTGAAAGRGSLARRPASSCDRARSPWCAGGCSTLAQCSAASCRSWADGRAPARGAEVHEASFD